MTRAERVRGVSLPLERPVAESLVTVKWGLLTRAPRTDNTAAAAAGSESEGSVVPKSVVIGVRNRARATHLPN